MIKIVVDGCDLQIFLVLIFVVLPGSTLSLECIVRYFMIDEVLSVACLCVY